MKVIARPFDPNVVEHRELAALTTSTLSFNTDKVIKSNARLKVIICQKLHQVNNSPLSPVQMRELVNTDVENFHIYGTIMQLMHEGVFNANEISENEFTYQLSPGMLELIAEINAARGIPKTV